ncbi:MAG: hypothetical protein QOI24_3720 [Acidobacteriota bacterium]|jgi:hypothetical protein|nr:hypothetical protein [Acidobacteriota bacterium]
MNKFVARSEGTRQVVTLLTGKLTFQEAQAMADTAAIEWVDDKGKTLSRQFGKVKIVRPMPVGCDGRASGVVMVVTFGSSAPPSKKMRVKFDAATTVDFEQQTQ